MILGEESDMADWGRTGKGKIALVTGGGTGIGLAVARGLSAEGYTVVITGRRLAVLEQAAAEISAETGSAVRGIACDVGDPAQVAAAFDQVKQAFGRLDLLVNNAGSNVSPALLEDIPFEEWTSILSANLTGAFLCTQQAFRIMKDQQPRGGRIINNGSISATAPRPNSAPYTATKHAITGLTKSTALDGRKYDIACGQIDIGNAATDMTSKMNAGVLQANGEIASEPTMSVKHVADAVIYMASLPLDANVLTMTVMATAMPFVGRG
jgi:NAD(P)-dependent dehydrogenase (short-subunit alcohol dehydrogenase family)